MMPHKIGIWATTSKKLDINEISDGSIICGGTERELLCLAKEFHSLYAGEGNAHPVYIFGNVAERGGIFSHALFFHYEDLPKILERDGLDSLIVARAHDAILSPRKSRALFGDKRPKKVILWSGDNYDQNNNEILYDKLVTDNIDAIVLKSEWQKGVWLENFVRLREKRIEVIRKGLNIESLPEERSECQKPRFIYASTAFRGLENFITIWPKIKEQIPDAILDCYARTTLYLDDNPQELSYKALYQQIEKLPDVAIKEPLSQKEFFKVLSNYYAMIYPNTFEETVCGVALEAMASGVPVITSERAGLIETIRDGKSILISGDPHSSEYVENLVDAVISLWDAKGARSTMSKEGFKRIRDKYDIKKTALQWKGLLDNLC